MSAEIWTKCLFFFCIVARSQKDQLVACTASGEKRWQPDFQIRVLVCLQRLPPMSGWLAAFSLTAKCCLHMFIHVATGCFIHQDGTYHS